MKIGKTVFTFMVVVIATAFFIGLATAAEQSEVDKMHKWKLEDLYKDLDAFEKDKDSIVPDGEKLAEFKGKLGDSAATLADALDLYYDVEMRIRRLQSYASRRFDQDTRVSDNKGYQDEVEAVATKFGQLSSFIDPELVDIGEKKLLKFLAKEPRLKVYDFPIRETLRRAKHILSPKEEAILAAAGDLYWSNESTYGIFTDADMPRVTITLKDGSEVKMTYPNFDKVRRSLVDEDRKAAFEAFFPGQYARFQRLLASTLYNQMKVHKFFSQSRGYESTLAAALDYNNIDTELYMSLIDAAHKNLPTFHRYLKLKARALGKEKLAYTDMYVAFTSDVKIPVKYDQAEKMLLESLAPLGEDYIKTLAEAFENRWVDVYPSEGKRSGAYSSGWAYGVHPYVLMNFNDTYSDTLTLAHEMGHAMHSYYSNSNQPFPTADYSTFVAEVASTFNENLLNDYMLKKVESDDERLYLLGNFLDGTIKGTFFRQIQFAEFELMIHQKVEKGEALTDGDLNKMYLELTRKYYGHDKGVVDVPEMIQTEWAAIPHFYYNYYVFQYSTSVAAASFLSEKALAGDTKTLENYYKYVLKAGGSDHPVNQLRDAGADMTKAETYDALMDRANRYMDELEKILDAKGL